MNQFTSHFEIVIREGINASMKQYDTLASANGYVQEYADAWSLNTKLDAEGWLSGCDNEQHPSHEIYLMEVQGEKHQQYIECCEMYGCVLVDEVISIVELTDPDGAWSSFDDMDFHSHKEILETLYFNF